MSVSIKSRKDKIDRILENESGPNQAVFVTEKDGKTSERLVRMFEPDPELISFVESLGFETGTDGVNSVECVSGNVRYRGHAGANFRQWVQGLSAGLSLYVASKNKKEIQSENEAFLAKAAEMKRAQRGPTKAELEKELAELRAQLNK